MTASKRTHFLISLASTALVLYMFSLFGLMVYVGNNLSGYLKENIVMNAYMKDSVDVNATNEFKRMVLDAPFVSRFVYIDKEQAAAIEKEALGQDFVEDIGYNPLPSSYEIYLKKEEATPEKIAEIKKRIATCSAVADLRYQDSELADLEKNFAVAEPVMFGLSLLFAIIAVILINNTVRLNIFSQRFLIKSMQLVGATENFIIQPYLVQSIKNGIYSGIAAALLVFNTGYLLLLFIPDLDVVLPAFQRNINLGLLAGLLLALSVAGILISGICTWFATHKYLRTRIDDLY